MGAIFGLVAPTQAAKIEGAISFSGSVTLNTKNVGTATSVTSWVSPKVENADGDFAGFVSSSDSVLLSAPWSFTTTSPIANFWQVGGFHFDLLSSAPVFQGYGFAVIEGSGIIYGNDFTPTVGTWAFTTQNPSASGRFSFSASAATVPESGATIALIGLTLASAGVLLRGPRRGRKSVG